jgi:large subunit ribosomal protein L13
MFTQKSFVLKPAEAQKEWFLVDASGKTVGRLATRIADVLRGKAKPQFTPHTDSGDFVVVINADKMVFTGNKLSDKKYYKHSGYVGGLKERTAGELMDKNASEVLMKAVKGMLPKNSLGRQQLTKLRVFNGNEHTHESQKPQALELA